MRGVLAQGYRVTFPAGNGAGSVCTGWEMLLQAIIMEKRRLLPRLRQWERRGHS